MNSNLKRKWNQFFFIKPNELKYFGYNSIQNLCWIERSWEFVYPSEPMCCKQWSCPFMYKSILFSFNKELRQKKKKKKISIQNIEQNNKEKMIIGKIILPLELEEVDQQALGSHRVDLRFWYRDVPRQISTSHVTS